VRRFAGFAAASVALIGAVLLVLYLVFPEEESRRAFRMAAAIAVVVQLLGFAVARAVAKENVMAGWGLGVLVRFAAVFIVALAAPGLGLPLGPGLLSLVGFLFVTTLIEPLFLKP
jgi:hypothetical protein